MTRSIAQVEALARSGFKRTINGGSWAGGCEALVNNLGEFTPYPTAVAAGDASGWLDGNPDTARRGEIHYYFGAGGDGHISFELGGGMELMGSSLAADLGEDLGWDIAIIDGDLYRARAAVSYRGHSFRHGTQTLDLTSPAGTGGVTLNQKDEGMTYALINRTPGDALPGVPKDAVFIGNGTDPLVWVSNWGPEMINGIAVAEWDAKSIADRISQVGLRGSGADLNRVYKSMADARAGGSKAVYTLGQGSVSVGDISVPSDPAVVAGLEKIATGVAAVKSAVDKLNPPG